MDLTFGQSIAKKRRKDKVASDHMICLLLKYPRHDAWSGGTILEGKGGRKSLFSLTHSLNGRAAAPPLRPSIQID